MLPWLCGCEFIFGSPKSVGKRSTKAEKTFSKSSHQAVLKDSNEDFSVSNDDYNRMDDLNASSVANDCGPQEALVIQHKQLIATRMATVDSEPEDCGLEHRVLLLGLTE